MKALEVQFKAHKQGLGQLDVRNLVLCCCQGVKLWTQKVQAWGSRSYLPKRIVCFGGDLLMIWLEDVFALQDALSVFTDHLVELMSLL